ncbi:MAG: YggS family pyridoxal phosphate-dependent enzyme [Moorea sp. SIO3C2]|nr:YggS family pyridoxal phosphate-dependent enzyme [Moorena sp. SIO3C2]
MEKIPLTITTPITDNIQQIRQQLKPNIRLIAVSKTVSVDKMREAYGAGIRDFGENRLQEACAKQEQLQDLEGISWHFIGHLQKNKAKLAVQTMDWIHSVDDFKLAQSLNRRANELDKRPKVCLQIKILPDPNKYGWSVEQLLETLPELEACDSLDIQGLMTILPLGLSESEIFDAFVEVAKFKEQLNQTTELNLKEVSMGMSGDYLQAIKAGATMIRIGSNIFGKRQ